MRQPRITAHYSRVDLTAGDFEHPEWEKAQPVQITRQWSGEEAPASRHANARIIWTEESLIARFICSQNEPLIVSPNPRLDQKAIRLWDRDVCEIFIAPDLNSPGRYFEFEAAPTGEWVDLAINLTPAGRETDFEFHSAMTVAASATVGRIIIGIQVPWSSAIPKPQPGDAWRVNLFRCVGVGNERYLAWQPTYSPEPNFHVPEVFGWLDFS